MNLHSLDVEDLGRGRGPGPSPDASLPVSDVELTCSRRHPIPYKHHTEVHFHHGSREILASSSSDRTSSNPETAVCQVRFPSICRACSGRSVAFLLATHDRCRQPVSTLWGARCAVILGTGDPLRPGSHVRRGTAAGRLRICGRGGLTVAGTAVLDMECQALDKLVARWPSAGFVRSRRQAAWGLMCWRPGPQCLPIWPISSAGNPCVRRLSCGTHFKLRPERAPTCAFSRGADGQGGQILLEGDILRLPAIPCPWPPIKRCSEP